MALVFLKKLLVLLRGEQGLGFGIEQGEHGRIL